jgi:hypothetical protein
MVPSLSEITSLEYVVDSAFGAVEQSLDGDLQVAYTIAVLLAYAEKHGFLNVESRQTKLVRDEIIRKIWRLDVQGLDLRVYVNNLDRVNPELIRLYPNGIPVLNDSMVKGIEDLKRDTQLLKGIKDSGLASDKSFRNAVRIADMIGVFGFVEADKYGAFDVYGLALLLPDSHIEVPFETMGDKDVCLRCRWLESGGPYKLEEFPCFPHNLCRCRAGNPLLVKN